ncbi:Spo11/DNA topoisomerase VI subunit A [Naviculisporaceae sp. PSN 640]
MSSEGSSGNVSNTPSLAQGGGFVPVPAARSNDGALDQVEDILESTVDSITNGVPLVIPYRTRNTRNVQDTSQSNETAPQIQSQVLMLPARSLEELKKFEAMFRLIELVHEALLSGTLITKRSIYYQNLEIFTSQVMVDDMVDNLAFTLGVGRDDLNIVATAKGLLAGPIDIKTRDGTVIDCGTSGCTGILLPWINSLAAVNFRSVRWLLVIEKEATFRTLVSSEYHLNSKAGHGVLVTAKGYPDLATRRFLNAIHSIRPQLPIFGLVDFDPHGISIFRTYQTSSRQLRHEESATVPGLRWLGIRSNDVLPYLTQTAQTLPTGDSQNTESQSSQESAAYSFNGLDDRVEFPPRNRVRTQQAQDTSGSIVPLTACDRKRAVNMVESIRVALANNTLDDADTARDQLAELQKMLMLNIKAEIQAVDSFGDVTGWLDQKLRSQLGV